MSNILSDERIAEIKAFKDKPDPDCPPLPDDFFQKAHPRNPAAFEAAIAEMRRQKQTEQAQAASTAAPAAVSVNLDADISEWLAKTGSDYSATINQILREVIRLGRMTATA
jgi:uncharacterized protein (DUF4415 family)